MRGDLAGDSGSQRGESPWEYSADQPPEPLRRKPGDRKPDADPTDGLLGA
jgi:hypothetical protein